MSESLIIVEFEFRNRTTLSKIKNKLSKIINNDATLEPQTQLEANLFKFCYIEKVITKGSKLYLYSINKDLDFLKDFITTSYNELVGELSFICVEDDAHFVVSNIDGQAVTLHSIGDEPHIDKKLEEVEWGYQSIAIVKDYYSKSIDKISAEFWIKYPSKGNLLFKLVCKNKKDAIYLRDSIFKLNELNDPNSCKNFVSEMTYRSYLKSSRNKSLDDGYENYLQDDENQEMIESVVKSVPFEVFSNLKFLVLSDKTVFLGSYLADTTNFEGEAGGDLDSLFSLFWCLVPSPKLRISIVGEKGCYDTDFFWIIATGCPVSFQSRQFKGVYDRWPVPT